MIGSAARRIAALEEQVRDLIEQNNLEVRVLAAALKEAKDNLTLRVRALEKKPEIGPGMVTVYPPRIPYGTVVAYAPQWAGRRSVWTGVVIPRPQGYPERSRKSDRMLTYVVRIGDRAIRGCFADNLRTIR